MEWPSSRIDTWVLGLVTAGFGILAVPDSVMLYQLRCAIVLWVFALLLFVCGFPAVQGKISTAYRRIAESYPRGAPVVTILVGLVVVMLLVRGSSFFLKSNEDLSQEVPFGVEVRTAFVSDSGPLTFYMVSYRSPLGLTVSPVFYLMFVRITNLQDVGSTISGFEVAVSEKKEGPWEELVSIPLFTSSLYSLGTSVPDNSVKPEDTPTLVMGPGAFRLTAMTMENMKYAIPLRPDRTLESEFSKPIPPHSPISGWVAFDSRRQMGVAAKEIYFRITLRDTAGKLGQYVEPLPIGRGDGASTYVDTGMMRIDGRVTDISSFNVKYYSDPFPNRK